MKKRSSYLLVVLLFVWLCAIPAAALDTQPVVILCTNDIHSNMQRKTDGESVTQFGLAGVAGYRKEMERQYGDGRVTLVDAGDAIQGQALGSLSNGAYPLKLINLAGYDFAVPGNHEFDYGMDTFLDLSRTAGFTYLCCNFLDSSGQTVFQPYSIVDYGDIRIAYLGIATPESFTKSTPAYFQDESGTYIYSFCEGEGELYASVQAAVDSARSEGADYVVALSHLGCEGITEQWRSDTVIANTTGIDVMLDGHSHEQYVKEVPDRTGEDVLLVQTGTKLEALGKVVIDPVSGKISGELIAGYKSSDSDVEQALRQIEEEVQALLQKEIAYINVTLTTSDPDTGKRAVRNAETNLGDLCADAFRTALNADVAFINGGSLRADLSAGPVTYEHILNVLPYGNRLCVAKVTGQQLLDALEWGVRLYPQESGGFLQVSGLSYAIDPTIPSSVAVDAQGSFAEVSGLPRVYDVKINGLEVDPAQIYRLASRDYLLKDSGDGYSMFDSRMVVEDDVMLDMDAVIDYIQRNLDGVMGTGYADPHGQGRISVTARAGEAFGSVRYTVQQGESLWRIAREQLGSGMRWIEIYRLNADQIQDPNLIFAGQELVLPAA